MNKNQSNSLCVAMLSSLFATPTNYLALLSLHQVCEKLLGNHPLDGSYALPTADCDCVQVWDVLEPESNVWRFVVYIEWLWRQPQAVRKYYKLRQEREASYRNCITLLDSLHGEARNSGIV